jgi:general nucleoside transport system ATP-binding protein
VIERALAKASDAATPAAAPPSHAPVAKTAALSVETIGMTKRFGAFTALDDVSIKVHAGTFHALLGENGAGKSTLVKCMMGFYTPTEGSLLVNDHEQEISNPRDAHDRGLGMVYQHFTLIPSLTAAENLVLSRTHVPVVIDWRREKKDLEAFLATMPFRVPLDRPISELAAGQKQKLEILKQIYLKSRFLILDEPTSVLTPGEAEEVLGLLKAMADRGEITVFMITHKFREVESFAEDVSVLRRGKLAGSGKAAELSRDDMAAMMIGSRTVAQVATREGAAADRPVLEIHALSAKNQSGTKSIAVDELIVHSREIVGIAGVSGNGQKELAEVLAGQRFAEAGEVRVGGTAYGATRAETREHQVRFIPEEPLRNACAPRMAVAENLSFRTFDVNGGEKPAFWLKLKSMRSAARVLVERFQVKTASLESPIATLSGGNVQRAVLARELTGDVDLLVVANPCFGLDFSAVAEIRSRIVAARNGGAAVLLISEDLDEILELADRILVMSEGKIVYETPGDRADVGIIGHHMAGHH